jgi:hypothetical protein
MARLSAQAIINYQNINSFVFANQWNVSAGDTNTLYFEVINLDQNIGGILTNQPLFRGGYPLNSPTGSASLRYLLGIGTSNQPYSITVTFPSIDSTKVINLNAFQADPNDSSVWGITIPSVYTPGSGTVIFKITQGLNIATFSVPNMISVDYPQNGGCDGTIPNNNSTAFN